MLKKIFDQQQLMVIQVIMVKYKIKNRDLFDKAYQYVAEYY